MTDKLEGNPMTLRNALAALTALPVTPPDWTALLTTAQPQALTAAWLASL